MRRLPKTVEEWMALPELPLGRYLVVNLGAMEADVSLCRVAGVQGLPPKKAESERGLAVRLPNVTVDDAGQPRVYRLPLDFGPVVEAIFDEAGRWHAAGRSLLPCHYSFGVRADGAYVIPDGAQSAMPAMKH